MRSMPPIPAHFWSLLALCLLAFLGLWWILLGSGRAARRRRLRMQIETLGPSEGAAMQASLSGQVPSLDDAPAPGRGRGRKSEARGPWGGGARGASLPGRAVCLAAPPAPGGGGDPLYATPWFL